MQFPKLVQALLFLGLACPFVGCERNDRMQQIRDGVENVDRYAEEIETGAKPLAR